MVRFELKVVRCQVCVAGHCHLNYVGEGLKQECVGGRETAKGAWCLVITSRPVLVVTHKEHWADV